MGIYGKSRIFIPFLAGAFGLVAVASPAQETIIAQDNFSYSNGSTLAGQNGGTGWTAPWVNDYFPGDSLTASSTGLTYAGMASNGSATWSGASGNGISEDSRYLPLQDSGLVYIQFLCQFGTQSGGGTPNLRFTDSLSDLAFGIGANGGTYGQNISLLDSSLSAAANGSQTATGSSLSSLNCVVALVDYNDDTLSMWVNPDLSNFNYTAPPVADATLTMSSAPDFNNVSIDVREGSISDLEIMSVPEPGTVALFCAGGLFLICCRFRNRDISS